MTSLGHSSMHLALAWQRFQLGHIQPALAVRSELPFESIAEQGRLTRFADSEASGQLRAGHIQIVARIIHGHSWLQQLDKRFAAMSLLGFPRELGLSYSNCE